MARYLLNTSEEQMQMVRERSEFLGIPMAQFFREAIDSYLYSGSILPGSFTASGVVCSGFVTVIRVQG